MAMIRIDLAETLLDGMDIKFKAPCNCNEITGIGVYYPKEDGTTGFKELVFRDSHGNDLTGIGNLFSKGAYVKVIVDIEGGYAYLQNATNNGFLNSAIFGTYSHDAENLIGSGENGKFKATVSGTISTIKVNGVDYSVKCGEEPSMDLVAGCWYTFILDDNTVNFSSGGGGFKPELLWENGKPTDPIETLTIPLDLTPYKWLAVLQQFSAGTTATRLQFGEVGRKFSLDIVYGTQNRIGNRLIDATAMDKIVVEGANYNQSASDNYCIPLKIYGIKG